jgi:hypothetical protein
MKLWLLRGPVPPFLNLPQSVEFGKALRQATDYVTY